jgi:DNA-binding transcriptional LysR family regulator
MELMQLEMFVTAYEERSFKRAAEKVYRTQPAVSLAIAKLEEEVGAPLLVRQRGRGYEFHLTRSGELLYEYALRMLGIRNELFGTLLPGARRRGEHLRLGVGKDWTSAWFEPLVDRFREQRPHVSVHLSQESPEFLCREIRDRHLDLVFFDRVPTATEAKVDTASTLVCLNFGEFGHQESLWMLRSRIGRSHVSLQFEEELRRSLAGRKESPINSPGAEGTVPEWKKSLETGGRPPQPRLDRRE